MPSIANTSIPNGARRSTNGVAATRTRRRSTTAPRRCATGIYGIRNKDQDSQGVVGEVVFPNTVPPFYRKSIVTAHPPKPEDYQRCLAGIRAHNRWLKDFCAEDPVRRAGIGLILPNDFDEAIKDIEFIAEGRPARRRAAAAHPARRPLAEAALPSGLGPRVRRHPGP